MEIFGRKIPSPEQILHLHASLISNAEIWNKENFLAAAKSSGIKKIAERKSGYFSFTADNNITGQAIVYEQVIEEIRMFIGTEPKNLDEKRWKQDKHKLAVVEKEYAEAFQSAFGTPRGLYGNKIYEKDQIRTRLLHAPPIWVVISNIPIITSLSRDYFPIQDND